MQGHVFLRLGGGASRWTIIMMLKKKSRLTSDHLDLEQFQLDVIISLSVMAVPIVKHVCDSNFDSLKSFSEVVKAFTVTFHHQSWALNSRIKHLSSLKFKYAVKAITHNHGNSMLPFLNHPAVSLLPPWWRMPQCQSAPLGLTQRATMIFQWHRHLHLVRTPGWCCPFDSLV